MRNHNGPSGAAARDQATLQPASTAPAAAAPSQHALRDSASAALPAPLLAPDGMQPQTETPPTVPVAAMDAAEAAPQAASLADEGRRSTRRVPWNGWPTASLSRKVCIQS